MVRLWSRKIGGKPRKLLIKQPLHLLRYFHDSESRILERNYHCFLFLRSWGLYVNPSSENIFLLLDLVGAYSFTSLLSDDSQYREGHEMVGERHPA